MKKQDILAAAKPSGDRFVYWLNFILDHEDATRKDGTIYTEHVAGDSGGDTFAGIDRSSHPRFPYSNPKPEDVCQAYLEDWRGCSAEILGEPVGEIVANYAVNMGRSAATALLHQSMQVAPSASGLQRADAIISLADDRYRHLASIHSNLRKFLRGWLNRNAELREFAKSEPDFSKKNV